MAPSFRSLADRYLREVSALFPTQATMMGIHKHDHQVESFSKEAIQEVIQFEKQYSRALAQTQQKTKEESFDAALMKVELAQMRLNFEELESWKKDPSIYPEIILYSTYLLIGRDS